MSRSLFIKNRQRTIPLNTRGLRWLTRAVLQDLLGLETYDIAIYIVRAPEMERLNKMYLQHEGSTDVITFNYGGAEPPREPRSVPGIHGEIFVCIDEAVSQARTFRTSWQSEIARYVIHGILHLTGHDDVRAADRRRMKQAEDRLLKQAAGVFPLRKLSSKPTIRA